MTLRPILLVSTVLFTFSQFTTESKTVVFLPLLVTSHTRAHAYVAEELAKMNHTVWVGMSSAQYKRKENFKGINTFSFSDFGNDYSEDTIIADIDATVAKAIATDTEPDFTWIMESIEAMAEQYFKYMKNGKLIEYIETLQPDLIVLDWNPFIDERIAVPYKLKVPFAAISALPADFISGRIPFSAVAEAYNSPNFRNNASFLAQARMIVNILSPLFLHLFNERGFMKQLFPSDPDVPSANELISQAEVYIVESDPIFDYPRPLVPNVKLVGGLSVGPARDLQEPFKSFLERSHQAGVGVVVFSFGSLFINLPKELENKVVSVLRRIKYNTIWRANVTSPDAGKILTSTWIPQSDLLAHKSVRVFMSHSGVHSLYESFYHGVPTVCLPLFFDQRFNAEKAQDKNYGRFIDIFKASADEFVNIIEEVASSDEIRSAVSTASAIYRELYKNPRQEAAFWLDHVMRHGGSYMRYSGQKIPMYVFLVDYVIVFLAGVVFTLAGMLSVVILKRIVRGWCSRKRHLKKD